MRRRTYVLAEYFVMLLLLHSTPAAAQNAKLGLDLPLIDAPYNGSYGYNTPSMSQSLALTRDFYVLSHYELERLLNYNEGSFGERIWKHFALYGFDIVSFELPLGLGWMHEEWHRAVMTHRGVSSYDDIYNLKPSSLTAVSHETDAALAALKASHPQDQVRLPEAGMESQHMLTNSLERDAFFKTPTLDHGFLLIYNELNVEGYLQTCAGKGADKTTDQQNVADGTDVSRRDFTGLDCDGWVYDLFRPNEPFADRGVHPSGVGINRYRHYSDLSGDERHFLDLQRSLGVLNFVDPFMWNKSRFSLGGNETANFNLRHFLTPFGYVIDVNAYHHSTSDDTTVKVHNYRNGSRNFPGLEVDEQSFHFGIVDLALGCGLWQQPKDLAFITSDASLGGFARARVAVADTPRFVVPFGEVEIKSAGWLPENVYLEANASVRLGIESYIF